MKSPLLFTAVLSAASIAVAVLPAVRPTHGRVTYINDIAYYVGGTAVSHLEGITRVEFDTITLQDVDIVPFTVIPTANATFDGAALDDIVADYTKRDDVFQAAFLSAIYLDYVGPSNTSSVLGGSIYETAIKYGNSVLVASSGFVNGTSHGVVRARLAKQIPAGPYFISPYTGAIFKAHRLYADPYLAFTEPAVSDEEGGFFPLPVTTESLMQRSVAVPSRLYYTPTEEKPLAGVRLAVKDIYNVRGLRTSGGNRAHYELYPPRNATAPSIQKLMDKGAVFIGKMNTVQFANSDTATADCVDVHCPFNPRGDGYNQPSGSSNGPAVGIAGYSWLDISVGSDTGGSMRFPAGAQGIYSNRPSTGAVPMDGVIPLCAAMDSAGVFTRSASLWSTVAHAWYDQFNTSFASFPKTLYYPNATYDPEVINNTAISTMVESFVSGLENFLGTERTNVSVDDQWAATYPEGAPESLADLLYLTYGILTSVYQWLYLGVPFFRDYALKYDGRTPFINPTPIARWRWAQEEGRIDRYDEAIQNKTLFMNWWNTGGGYGHANEETCSEGLFVRINSQGDPSPRNVYLTAPTGPYYGSGDTYYTIWSESPEVVIPIGEVPYTSTISNHTEYLPVTMAIIAARGCDLMLGQLLVALEKEGIAKPVATGRMLFP